MRIWIRNNRANPHNAVDYKFYGVDIERGVIVPKLVGTITLPARAIESFRWLWLVANQDGSGAALVDMAPATRPARDVARCVSAFGTEPGNTNLIKQTQTGLHVQYVGDYVFDSDLAGPTGYQTVSWASRSHFNAWPAGIVSDVYFRLEAIPTTDPGSGVNAAQSNVAQDALGGDFSFKTQVMGLARVNQPEVRRDHCRIPIEPTSQSNYAIMADSPSRGRLLVSGYEVHPQGWVQ